MKFTEYKTHVAAIKTGKSLPSAIYLHQTAIQQSLPPSLHGFFKKTLEALNITAQWNLIKLYKRDFKITLLHYPNFDTYAYPALHTSTTIDLDELTHRTGDYSQSDNPPILHRKEHFILASHPSHETFKAITREGEALELYKNTRTIGFKNNWARLIKRKHHQLDEAGRLHPIPTSDKQTTIENTTEPTACIERHRTAINRDRLSAPFQKLAKFGYLDGEHSILDYGCGRGDDLRELEAHGLTINGWDPVHNPEGICPRSDITNLGFVLNVIEEQEERAETLKRAYQHTNKLLVVSVMLLNENKIGQFTPYKDGVITQRNTFQKYYTQTQIHDYIAQTLKTQTVAFGQGIIGIFKDKNLEESHHLELQFCNHDWQHITQRERPQLLPKVERQSLYTKHQPLFDDFWQHCIHFGRIPANDEFELSNNLRTVIGSHNKAFALLQGQFEQATFEQSIEKRHQDLLVYFSLSLFGKRKAKTHMPTRLQRDLKVHFSDYKSCIETAQQLLFSVGSPANIGNACHQAYKQFVLGQLDDSHSYTFPRHLLNSMPAIIRVYVGCASQLYGDIDDVDLIKVHMRSGKVTLLTYDDFTKALPLLTERTKIRLLDLDIDYFSYGDQYPLAPLYNKVDFIKKGTEAFKKQAAFDKRLASYLEGLPLEKLPDWEVLQKILSYKKVMLKRGRFTKC